MRKFTSTLLVILYFLSPVHAFEFNFKTAWEYTLDRLNHLTNLNKYTPFKENECTLGYTNKDIYSKRVVNHYVIDLEKINPDSIRSYKSNNGITRIFIDTTYRLNSIIIFHDAEKNKVASKQYRKSFDFRAIDSRDTERLIKALRTIVIRCGGKSE